MKRLARRSGWYSRSRSGGARHLRVDRTYALSTPRGRHTPRPWDVSKLHATVGISLLEVPWCAEVVVSAGDWCDTQGTMERSSVYADQIL